MKRLAIFDIDGTLAQTPRVDDACFVRALEEEFGFQGINTDWGAYVHSTDSWIVPAIFREKLGRDPSAEELERMRARFVRNLGEARDRDPGGFAPTPGARDLLARLGSGQVACWAAAIATGGWRVSATLKLRAAGFDINGLPAAFSDDAVAREDIIRRAIDRATQTAGVERFGGGAVYVGDGVWDVRAAREAGLGFVGVAATDAQAARLRDVGAKWIIQDFADFDATLRLLEQALADSQESRCYSPSGA
jgi:phosphoglycolate phosphatase-like HAD superfamily hydrolase